MQGKRKIWCSVEGQNGGLNTEMTGHGAMDFVRTALAQLRGAGTK